MKKIIILDFTSGKVYIRTIAKENETMEASEIVIALEGELEIKESECQYMVTNSNLIVDIQ